MEACSRDSAACTFSQTASDGQTASRKRGKAMAVLAGRCGGEVADGEGGAWGLRRNMHPGGRRIGTSVALGSNGTVTSAVAGQSKRKAAR